MAAGVAGVAGGGGLPAVATTVTANGVRTALLQPSLAAMTMSEYVPTLVAGGVPDR